MGPGSRVMKNEASGAQIEQGQIAAGPPLRMVAWELTRNCNLSCMHCRASASCGPFEGELTTAECKNVIDSIVSFASPTIILTGGEPLLREDIFEIIDYGRRERTQAGYRRQRHTG